jgi:hypothetical protein
VVLLSGGVAAFMIAGQPYSSADPGGPLRHWLVVGTMLVLAFVLVVLARRLGNDWEPPLLAAAAGTLYGLQDALTRTASDIFSEGGLPFLLSSWQPYADVALALTGLLLVQSAFELGPLHMSLPTLTASEPLVGIACGIGFLGDRLLVTPGALIGEALGLAAIVFGVFLLGRHPMLPAGAHRENGEHSRSKDGSAT